jgi:hypothetical protein
MNRENCLEIKGGIIEKSYLRFPVGAGEGRDYHVVKCIHRMGRVARTSGLAFPP